MPRSKKNVQASGRGLKAKKPKPIPDVEVEVTVKVSAEKLFGLARMLPIHDCINGQTEEEAADFDYKRAITNKVLAAAVKNDDFLVWMAAKIQLAKDQK